MTTVVIPAQLSERADLVAVPRDEYEEFVAWQKSLKASKTYVPTAAEKRSLAQARKRRRRGNFVTFDELRRKLAINR